ncbi:hypothetical protein [Paenibacillus koleovorans]|uniref:hypothetical protein n=1 Tax=Paenibacillus koleovorans TaxID=121608 RepID=UPI000FDA51FE|nr:hypothetical protein [Paenibacillus koleovorans]
MKIILTSFTCILLIIVLGCSSKHNHNHTYSSENMPDTTDVLWSINNTESEGQYNVSAQVFDQRGKPLNSFDVFHEKKMHLFVVSKDLTYFDHLHPEDHHGKFETTIQFPFADEYKLIGEYMPSNKNVSTKYHWIKIEGEKAPTKQIVPDTSRIKFINNIEVSISVDRVAVGNETEITYAFTNTDPKSKKVKINKYLGSYGHVIFLSNDLENYLHAHASISSANSVTVTAKFPENGVYKFWGQFLLGKELITVPYVISVQ